MAPSPPGQGHSQPPARSPDGRSARAGEGPREGGGPGAGQGRAGLCLSGLPPGQLPGRSSRKSRHLWGARSWCLARPKALAMRTLWMVLCALTRLWPGVLGGCAEAGRCCPGRDPACFAHGWRLDRVYGTCFCDQACRLTGDCCFDYARACPGGWLGPGWDTSCLSSANLCRVGCCAQNCIPGTSSSQALPSWHFQSLQHSALQPTCWVQPSCHCWILGS